MSLPRACFIAGTDTGVGKTLVSCALLEALAAQGRVVAGLKPVAAGAGSYAGGRANGDALALAAASNLDGLGLAEINPVLLDAPLSPHIAAAREGRRLAADDLAERLRPVLEAGADHVLVEGAGGWLAPISGTETMADLARVLGLPVILVVGLRLGCLNHALLTAQAIDSSGLPLYGWVASRIDPEMDAVAENVETLAARLPGRMLGCVPRLDPPSPASAACHLRLNG